MYRKVLLPLDDSEESRSVVNVVPTLVEDGGEAILLHVIPPGKTKTHGGFTVLGSQLEEEGRSRAMVHLNRLSGQLNEASVQATCTVLISKSVADGIADFAKQEEVDLIAMFTHGRMGVAKLLRGSVTEAVRQKATVEVRAFESSELAAAASG